MLQAIEGIYRNGRIELAEVPAEISESRVIVTFLEVKPSQQSGQRMRFGMFAGSNQSIEEDMRSAEFRGDADDRLDWS